jgi:hypothetical protein
VRFRQAFLAALLLATGAPVFASLPPPWECQQEFDRFCRESNKDRWTCLEEQSDALSEKCKGWIKETDALRQAEEKVRTDCAAEIKSQCISRVATYDPIACVRYLPSVSDACEDALAGQFQVKPSTIPLNASTLTAFRALFKPLTLTLPLHVHGDLAFQTPVIKGDAAQVLSGWECADPSDPCRAVGFFSWDENFDAYVVGSKSSGMARGQRALSLYLIHRKTKVIQPTRTGAHHELSQLLAVVTSSGVLAQESWLELSGKEMTWTTRRQEKELLPFNVSDHVSRRVWSRGRWNRMYDLPIRVSKDRYVLKNPAFVVDLKAYQAIRGLFEPVNAKRKQGWTLQTLPQGRALPKSEPSSTFAHDSPEPEAAIGRFGFTENLEGFLVRRPESHYYNDLQLYVVDANDGHLVDRITLASIFRYRRTGTLNQSRGRILDIDKDGDLDVELRSNSECFDVKSQGCSRETISFSKWIGSAFTPSSIFPEDAKGPNLDWLEDVPRTERALRDFDKRFPRLTENPLRISTSLANADAKPLPYGLHEVGWWGSHEFFTIARRVGLYAIGKFTIGSGVIGYLLRAVDQDPRPTAPTVLLAVSKNEPGKMRTGLKDYLWDTQPVATEAPGVYWIDANAPAQLVVAEWQNVWVMDVNGDDFKDLVFQGSQDICTKDSWRHVCREKGLAVRIWNGSRYVDAPDIDKEKLRQSLPAKSYPAVSPK